MNRRVNVYLSDEEDQFIKWLADRDNVSYQDELKQIFYFELEQLQMLYLEEMKGEQK